MKINFYLLTQDSLLCYDAIDYILKGNYDPTGTDGMDTAACRSHFPVSFHLIYQEANCIGFEIHVSI